MDDFLRMFFNFLIFWKLGEYTPFGTNNWVRVEILAIKYFFEFGRILIGNIWDILSTLFGITEPFIGISKIVVVIVPAEFTLKGCHFPFIYPLECFWLRQLFLLFFISLYFFFRFFFFWSHHKWWLLDPFPTVLFPRWVVGNLWIFVSCISWRIKKDPQVRRFYISRMRCLALGSFQETVLANLVFAFKPFNQVRTKLPVLIVFGFRILFIGLCRSDGKPDRWERMNGDCLVFMLIYYLECTFGVFFIISPVYKLFRN